jgi:hypothetical protein
MRRNFWVIAATVVVGLLLTATLAQAGTISKPNAPKAQLGQIYDRTNILRYDEGPVRLPRPVSGPAATASTSSGNDYDASPASVAGPVAASFDSPATGGMMPAPRAGGSMYSGQQQADREIKKLIRRLN